jgi:hypothetical protein
MGQLRKYRSNDETTGAEGNSSPDLNVIWTFKRVPVVFFLVMNFNDQAQSLTDPSIQKTKFQVVRDVVKSTIYCAELNISKY